MKKRQTPQKPLTNKAGDVRELTTRDFKNSKPLKDVFPALAELSERRRRGRPKTLKPKKLISFKLSPDIINAIRESGAGYNIRVENALRDALDNGMI